MNQKWNLDIVGMEFRKRGCVLISRDYRNTKQPLDYIAACGHRHTISLDNFLAGKGLACKECRQKMIAEKHRTSYENIQKAFEARGCKLLSPEYHNNNEKLEYIASCGHHNQISFSKFRDGGGTVCAKCSKSVRYDYDEVFDAFLRRGCLLLEKEYINCKTPMRFLARCGHEHILTFDVFQHVKGSEYCRACKKITYHDIDSVAKLFRDRGCEVIDGQYVPKGKIHYVARCGHRAVISLDKFLTGQGTMCPDCSRARGEKHPNYNPNLTDEQRLEHRDVFENIKWRKAVYERDGYTCQICGNAQGGNLTAHHLNAYSDFPEERFDPDNGITLCEECHKQFHSIYGYKHCIVEQFTQWSNSMKTPR